MELTTGKKSNKEIAEWMGINSNTFSKYKEKYLEKLEGFAEFHVDDRGKIIIDKVLDPVYDKAKGSSAAIIMEEVPKKWDKSNLDTLGNVGRKIQKEYQEKDPDGKIANLAIGTITNYAGKGRTYYYGSPYFHTEGVKGSSEFRWSKKKVDEYGIATLSELTPEELKIKDELVEKYYGKTQDQMLFIIEGINTGAISGKEVGEALEKIAAEHKRRDTYRYMMKELNERLGCTVVKGTYIKRREDEEGFPEMKLIEMEEE